MDGLGDEKDEQDFCRTYSKNRSVPVTLVTPFCILTPYRSMTSFNRSWTKK